jgi:hypothetical protein
MAGLGKGIVIGMVAALVLAACDRGAPRLMNVRTDGTPDEFAILPTKPLELPKTFGALPEPEPGGANLADPTPKLDAVAALGGSPRVAAAEGIPAGDQGLLGYAGRYGTASGIRQVLASEDLAFREENKGRVLERVFRVNVYYTAYREMALDQYAELARMRAAGVRTPAAPPEPAKK